MTTKILRTVFGSSKNILAFESFALACFILEGHIRVFESENVAKNMGFNGKAPNWLYDFVTQLATRMKVPDKLRNDLETSIFFEIDDASPAQIAILPEVLLDAANFIIRADAAGHLYLNEFKYAKAAEIFIANSDQLNAKIDYAAGFDRYKSNLKEILIFFALAHTTELALHWIRSIPDDIIEELLKFYGLSWADVQTDSGRVVNYLIDLIFLRLDSMVLMELISSKPRMKYKKSHQIEQYIPHPKLVQHLHAITSLMKASGGNNVIFNQLLNKSFPIAITIYSVPIITGKTIESSVKMDLLNKVLTKIVRQ